MRGNDEKQALALHRYKNWVESVTTHNDEFMRVQAHFNAVVEKLVYCYLEAREEQEGLLELGLTQEQIESVAKLPPMPLDPLTILKQAKDA